MLFIVNSFPSQIAAHSTNKQSENIAKVPNRSQTGSSKSDSSTLKSSSKMFEAPEK